METWEGFFSDFFDRSKETIAVVLNAWTCREGWLHGELFRAGHERGMKVGRYSLGGGKKADLCCFDPPKMVAEVKIIGADHDSKMRFFLDADVDRLKGIEGAIWRST